MTYRKEIKNKNSFLGKIIDKYIIEKPSSIVKKGALYTGLGIGFLLGGNYANAQEATKIEETQSLVSRIKIYSSKIDEYQSKGKKEQAKEQLKRMQNDLSQSKSNLEEALKVYSLVNEKVDKTTIARYILNTKLKAPKDEKQKKKYVSNLKALAIKLYFQGMSSKGIEKIELLCAELAVNKELAKQEGGVYTSKVKRTEASFKSLYNSLDEKTKEKLDNLTLKYDSILGLYKPKQLQVDIEPAKEPVKQEKPVVEPKKVKPEEPKKVKPIVEPKKVKPKEPKKVKPIVEPKKVKSEEPKKVKPIVEPKKVKPKRTTKKTTKKKTPVKKTTKKRTPPKRSPIKRTTKKKTPVKKPLPTKEQLESRAMHYLDETYKHEDINKLIELERKALLLYKHAESKSKKIEFKQEITQLQNSLMEKYGDILVFEEDKNKFDRTFESARRTLDPKQTKQLEERLKYSELRKKRGTDKIKNQIQIEIKGGENVTTKTANQKLRFAKQEIGEILQQHKQQTIETNSGEKKQTTVNLGYINSSIKQINTFIEASCGQEQTITESRDYHKPFSETHESDAETKYRTKITSQHGGAKTQINLNDIAPAIITMGGSYNKKIIYTKQKTQEEIENLNNQNGDYPEETITEATDTIRQKIVFAGAGYKKNNFTVTGKIGAKTTIERFGQGTQRTKRNANEIFGALETKVMLSKNFGLGGIIIRGWMHDEFYPANVNEDFEPSKENNIFITPRGGAAGVLSIPGPVQLNVFAKYLKTEDIEKTGGGILFTTGKNNEAANKLLDILMQETEADLGISSVYNGGITELIKANNLSLFSAMTENGNKWGFGIGARADEWNIPRQMNAWAAQLSAALETPIGTFFTQYYMKRTPTTNITDCRIGYTLPDKNLNLELIIKQIKDKNQKHMTNEMGFGIAISF